MNEPKWYVGITKHHICYRNDSLGGAEIRFAVYSAQHLPGDTEAPDPVAAAVLVEKFNKIDVQPASISTDN